MGFRHPVLYELGNRHANKNDLTNRKNKELNTVKQTKILSTIQVVKE